MLDEVAWLLQASVEEVSQKYYKRVDADALAKSSRIIADALYHKELAGSLGLDSNWGQGDLIHCGTALIDMTEEQERSIAEPKRDADGQAINERVWLVNYEAKALPSTVNKWRDPGDRVVLDRSMTPWTWSEVVVAG
jgi:hypothetical protein